MWHRFQCYSVFTVYKLIILIFRFTCCITKKSKEYLDWNEIAKFFHVCCKYNIMSWHIKWFNFGLLDIKLLVLFYLLLNDFQRVGFKNANLNFRNPTVQKLCICKIRIFTVFYRLARCHITLINHLIGRYKWALN